MRKHMKWNLFVAIITIQSMCEAVSRNDGLITKANIYYVLPPTYGEPQEVDICMLDQDMLHTDTMKDIKIIVHGFVGSRFHTSIEPLKNAYLANGYKNIFLADWQDAASLDYPAARKSISKVALFFGKMLNNFFRKFKIQPNDVHIIGHSLGAHIAGGIGRFFNGTLGRITGLDPALPLFSSNSEDALQASAANFVDVIHTDYPIFGDLTPRGTADFFPNYGFAPQRGCNEIDLVAASKLIFEAYSCSHNRATILFAESVGLPRSFPTLPCSWEGIRMRNIEICFESLNLSKIFMMQSIVDADENNIVYMGEKMSRSAKGLYYFDTYDVPPFGMGVYTKY